jgi:hypothetical protein
MSAQSAAPQPSVTAVTPAAPVMQAMREAMPSAQAAVEQSSPQSGYVAGVGGQRSSGAPSNAFVQLASMNIDLSSEQAEELGVAFGQNGSLRFGQVDEAQFLSLLELEGKSAPSNIPGMHAREVAVASNAEKFKLANGTNGRLSMAGPFSSLLMEDQSLMALPSEQIVLIDNGSYLTAVKAGPRQARGDVPAAVVFPQAVQRIDIPAIGQRLKFEKALIQPSDEPNFQIQYMWKGN